MLLGSACSSSRDTFDGAGGDGGNGGPVTSGFDDSGISDCPGDPAKFDIPGNGCDDDGDGQIDNPAGCDQGLSWFAGAADFVKALGLCKTIGSADDPGWGVVSASFTRGRAAGTPADGQHGILPAFGNVITPREGASLGVLSTGWARTYDDVEATSCDAESGTHCFKQGVQMQDGQPVFGATPAGYPRATGSCAVADQIFDPISAKITVKVPSNAKGFRVNFDFWSGEWPDYVCSKFNDGFLMILQSRAFNGGTADNIAFDGMGNALSVNNGFFDRCTASTQTGCRGEPPIVGTSTCAGGPNELEGTGFYAPFRYCSGQESTGGGATGWLTTQAMVTPGEVITLEFLIWDTGDPKFDSTVLLDGFSWIETDISISTERVK